VAIGDVCGHGVEAAKLTALARWGVQSAANDTDDPAETLGQLAQLLQTRPEHRFLTAQLATLDPGRGRLDVSFGLAGHPPAMIRRRDGTVDMIGPGGQLLGAFDDPHISRDAAVLDAGDVLVLYTDGLIESRGRRRGATAGNGALYGEERLRATLSGTCGLDAGGTVAALRHSLTTWRSSPHDDVAIVAVAPAPIDGEDAPPAL
jgi:serine phosphatase RsbU (regulator of sigma subunit)